MRPRAYRSDSCRASKGAPIADGSLAPGPVKVPAVSDASKAEGDGCKPYVVITYVQRKKKPFSSEPVHRRTVSNDAEFIQMLKASVPEVRALAADAQFLTAVV